MSFIQPQRLYIYRFKGSRGFETIHPQILAALSNELLVQQDVDAVEFALNEAVSNALHYGCGGPETAEVVVRLRFFHRQLVIRIKDRGQGFSVAERIGAIQGGAGDPFAKLVTSDHGRGIVIMLLLVDRVIYNACGNEVMLVKKLV